MGRLKGLLLSLVLVYILMEALLFGYRSFSRRPHKGGRPKAQVTQPARVPPIEQADILFEEILCVPVDLATPQDVAAGNDGRIVVVGDHRMIIFDSQGAVVTTLTLEASPMAVAMDATANIYVAMKDYVEVHWGGSSNRQVWVKPSDQAHFTSLTVGPTGVFVADYGCRQVWHFDLDGRLRGRLGPPDEGGRAPVFILPTPHFDVLSVEGSVWVSNPGRRRLEEYAPDGRLISQWGESSSRLNGFCGRANPSHFARLPDGRFVTSEKGLRRVKIYSSVGRFLGLVAPLDTFGRGAAGPAVATDRLGRVIVLDPRTRELRIYVEKGRRPTG